MWLFLPLRRRRPLLLSNLICLFILYSCSASTMRRSMCRQRDGHDRTLAARFACLLLTLLWVVCFAYEYTTTSARTLCVCVLFSIANCDLTVVLSTVSFIKGRSRVSLSKATFSLWRQHRVSCFVACFSFSLIYVSPVPSSYFSINLHFKL